MGKTLILVGGGHAHMETLAHLEEFVQKGFQVTVVGPSTHHYYSGMGPGMLGNTYTPEEICFATKHVVEKKGGTFIEDKGIRIDPDTRTLFLHRERPCPMMSSPLMLAVMCLKTASWAMTKMSIR